MRPRRLALLGLLVSFSISLFPQGLNVTSQTKEQWEEINFEFNSSILSDGYPSLLRLADLLKQHSDYKVTLDGNTDWVGSGKYNDKLSMRRAQTVKEFLLKYGASANQIEIAGDGKKKPEANNHSKEGRFMNRRVVMTVTDGQGRNVSAGGVGEAIAAIQQAPGSAPAKDCCDELLKKLDKLDEILAMLKDVKAENSRLRRDVDALKGAETAVQKEIASLPTPVTPQEVEKTAAKEADRVIQASKPSRFSLLGLNGGVDDVGRLNFTGKGRFFAPMGKTGSHAFQAEAEYMHWYDRQEGQFDFGMVNRFRNVQLGLFTSFKHVDIRQFQSGGTLGEGAVTFDWLFGRGKIGVFGTKGFLDNAVLSRVAISPDFAMENYLKMVDQVGVSTAVNLFGMNYLEANLGYLKSPGHVDRPGGTVRLIFPMKNGRVAFTVEGGLNETMLMANNSGRVAVGVQLGNWMQPKDYKAMTTAVPADIPRVRYELLSRRVRTGIGIPVADAGPNQIGIAAGLVSLNGSASHDPDGEPLTFQWSQITGPTVALNNATSAIASFSAAAGQAYAFRLVVKNPEGGQGSASTNVTTVTTPGPRILTFTATPNTITAGASSVVVWQVENADTVTLNGTTVNSQSGSSTFAPQITTQYTLIAKNSVGQVSATATITVTAAAPPSGPRILLFQATPDTIAKGASSTLNWATDNASTVTISGIGNVALNGSQTVSPQATTAYTLTATNSVGQVTASATVTVQAAVPPPGAQAQIRFFQAHPSTINQGASSTLIWATQNATTVTISGGVGTVAPSGSKSVSPQATTTYTLTASNAAGQVTATATVTVQSVPPRIRSFRATPETINKGDSSNLTWDTENASQVVINNGIGTVALNGSQRVSPQVTTTYILTASNAAGQVTSSVTVTVNPPVPAPVIVAFQAAPTTITQGGSSTLTWTTQNANTVTISGGVGSVPVNGTKVVSPTVTTTYTLTATNATGQVTATATVTVQAGTVPQIVQFVANPSQVTAGQACTLTWQVTGADSVTIDNGVGKVAGSGNQAVKPTATTIYTLTAVNTFGQATAKASCTVTSAPPTGVQVLEFIATPNYSPTPGGNVILQWQTVNAVTVQISGLTGTLPLRGATTLRPTVTTTYILTATSATGATATASVTVTLPPPANAVSKQPPVADAGTNTQTLITPIYLDGSHSYDPAGGPLTYLWTAVTPGAFLINPTLVSPTAFTGPNAGAYVFMLTVTNSAGVSATASVTITYTPGDSTFNRGGVKR